MLDRRVVGQRFAHSLSICRDIDARVERRQVACVERQRLALVCVVKSADAIQIRDHTGVGTLADNGNYSLTHDGLSSSRLLQIVADHLLNFGEGFLGLASLLLAWARIDLSAGALRRGQQNVR